MTCSRGCCDTPAEHFRSIGTAHRLVPDVTRRERVLSADLAAYKRLRESGLQPAHTRGAHRMEQTAEIPQEIGLGHLLPKDVKGFIKNGDGVIEGV